MRLTWDEATDIAMALEQQPGETLDSTGLDLYGDGEAASWNDAEGFTSSSWLVKGGTGAGSEGGEDLGPEVLSEEANDNWAHFDQQAQEGDSLSGGGGAGWAVVQQDDWMDYTQHASPAPVGHVPVPRRGQGGVDSGSKSREVLEECFKAQSHSESHSHSHSKGAVRSRVEDVLEPDQQVERTGSDDEAKSDACMGMEHSMAWTHLCRRCSSVRHWRFPVFKRLLHSTLFPHQSLELATSPNDLPDPKPKHRPTVATGNNNIIVGFEWTSDSDRDISLSPELVHSFRHGLDSPIQLEFDHTRAAIGLAMLSVDELEIMAEEMHSKSNHLSDTLVTELQSRDFYLHQLDAKNKFVSAILKVQNLRYGFGTSGASIEQGKFLRTVIPYVPPSDLHWSVSTLQRLNKILQAITEDSDKVPNLMSEYLQTEVLGYSEIT